MRMWNVNPKTMCRAHLLGEHLEMHMFAGAVRCGTNLNGYMREGLVDMKLIPQRHDELAAEMIRRGYNHVSPLAMTEHGLCGGLVNCEASKEELKRRCPKCKSLQEEQVC